MALNEAGDLFVLNADGSGILRYPSDGGPATVFSTISGQGGLDFAPNGDLFLAPTDLFRITPDGMWSVFDDPPGPVPTVSKWGLMVMSFVVLTVGSVVLRQRNLRDLAARVQSTRHVTKQNLLNLVLLLAAYGAFFGASTQVMAETGPQHLGEWEVPLLQGAA